MVETVEIHQMMWLLMLESTNDRILGVNTPRTTGVVTCPVWNDLLTN
jgi:hypothetical protein